jgi:hypothetical protein
MATLADFRTRFPEFASTDDAVIELNIDDAELEVSTAFGTYQDVATLFLAAHYLVLSQDAADGASGSVGGVASESVDGVSQSFSVVAANSQSDQLLASTVYGQRFLSYRQKIAIGNVMVV